jgi:predicted nuclease of predicted toxin-antitoxin system
VLSEAGPPVAKFLIDESLPRRVGAGLAAARHDVLDVRDIGLRGAPDGVIHARAVADDRILVSGDTDFANTLRFRLGTHPGIVVIRVPSSWSPTDRSERLVLALDDALLAAIKGATVIVEPARVRVLRASR